MRTLVRGKWIHDDDLTELDEAIIYLRDEADRFEENGRALLRKAKDLRVYVQALEKLPEPKR
jgi:hypothetical protein